MDAWAYHNPVLALLAVAILGYLLGSIPFGVLLTRAAGVGDVRNIGSGNIGATNVLRTGRRDLALATLVLDGGKAALAIAITLYLFMDLAEVRTLEAVAGASAFLGHLFPVWLGFKGGKGVATFFGALLVAAWPVGVAAAMTWMTVAFPCSVGGSGAVTLPGGRAGSACPDPGDGRFHGRPDFCPPPGEHWSLAQRHRTAHR